jgi:hypothetical protein
VLSEFFLLRKSQKSTKSPDFQMMTINAPCWPNHLSWLDFAKVLPDGLNNGEDMAEGN